MDEDTIDTATERWVDAGVIEEGTAEAIRAFEQHRRSAQPSRNRLAWILAVMGTILVGTGVLTLLWSEWETMPTWMRTGILLFAPLVAAIVGLTLDHRDLPRVGHAAWLLGAILVGPSVFLLAALHAPDVPTTWLFLCWGAIAVPMGHAFQERLSVAVGLIVFMLAVFSGSSEQSGPFVVAAIGSVVVAVGVLMSDREPGVGPVYQLVGVSAGLVVFLFVSTMEGRVARIAIGWDAMVLGSIGLAGLVVAALARGTTQSQNRPAVLGVVGAPVAGAVALLVLVKLDPSDAWFVMHLLVQALFLGYLVVIATSAVALDSRWLINLSAIGFLLLVLANLVILADVLPGAIALVTAGLILVVVAIAIERGRRRLLTKVTG